MEKTPAKSLLFLGLTASLIVPLTLFQISHAQSPSDPFPNCPIPLQSPDWGSWDYPSEPFANGTPTLRFNSAGALAYWYSAPLPNGAKSLSFAYLAASAVSPAYLSSLAADLAASGAKAALMARSNLAASSPDARAIWCPFWPEMTAGMNLPPPGPVESPDGSLAPPLASLIDASLNVWSIRPADSVVMLGSVATNGHATQLEYHQGNNIYAKSPNGGFWYKWLGNNTWQRLTTAQP